MVKGATWTRPFDSRPESWCGCSSANRIYSSKLLNWWIQILMHNHTGHMQEITDERFRKHIYTSNWDSIILRTKSRVNNHWSPVHQALHVAQRHEPVRMAPSCCWRPGWKDRMFHKRPKHTWEAETQREGERERERSWGFFVLEMLCWNVENLSFPSTVYYCTCTVTILSMWNTWWKLRCHFHATVLQQRVWENAQDEALRKRAPRLRPRNENHRKIGCCKLLFFFRYTNTCRGHRHATLQQVGQPTWSSSPKKNPSMAYYGVFTYKWEHRTAHATFERKSLYV